MKIPKLSDYTATRVEATEYRNQRLLEQDAKTQILIPQRRRGAEQIRLANYLSVPRTLIACSEFSRQSPGVAAL